MKSAIITTLLFLSLFNVMAQSSVSQIIYEPIGVFHSQYTTKTGAPRQGVLMPENKGVIEIYPEYHTALNTLSLYEYIIVIYHFSEVETWESLVTPPSSSHEHVFGVFATRSPKRPNPIGFSIIKLERIEKGMLFVSGLDAFDGTPVLDIKPYLPSIDCIQSVQNNLIEEELGHHDEIYITDSTFYK